MRISAFLMSLALTLFVGCGSSEVGETDVPPAKLPDPVSDEPSRAPVVDNRVKVGDSLELFVKEDPSLNDTYLVRERGDIIIPSLGRIPVAGLDMNAAGDRIEAALEKSQLTTASVILDRVGRAKEKEERAEREAEVAVPTVNIFMTGKVNRPGQHRIPIPQSGRLGVYEAILMAGGIGRFGDPQKVHLLRTGDDGNKVKIPVNIRLIEKGIEQDPPIGSGDIVVVQEKSIGF